MSEAARAPKLVSKPSPAPAEGEGEETTPEAEPEAAPEPEPEVGAEEEETDRFWDPRSRTSFRFDHLTLVRDKCRALYVFLQMMICDIAVLCPMSLMHLLTRPNCVA